MRAKRHLKSSEAAEPDNIHIPDPRLSTVPGQFKTRPLRNSTPLYLS